MFLLVMVLDLKERLLSLQMVRSNNVSPEAMEGATKDEKISPHTIQMGSIFSSPALLSEQVIFLLKLVA